MNAVRLPPDGWRRGAVPSDSDGDAMTRFPELILSVCMVSGVAFLVFAYTAILTMVMP